MFYQVRFIYSCHKSLDRAELALEDYFATGEVSLAEHPRIERKDTPRGPRWAVVIDG